MHPSDGNPLPVTVVGGYLGSGKTTLINNLLNSADGHRYAVLVNDFGELAIDAQLIEKQDGNVISLSGGCICCSYGNDLTSALLELKTDTIDQVVIEASGVALPGSIVGSLSLLPHFFTSSVVVLADSSTIEAHAINKYLADTIERQLKSADIIAINKIDLVDDEKLARIHLSLEDTYPSSRLINVSHANYPLDLFLMDTAKNVANRSIISADDAHRTSMYNTFVLDLPGEYDVRKLGCTLTDKAMGVLRAKGFVRDIDGIMQTLQIVGERTTIQPAPDGVSAGMVCIGLSGECSEQVVKSVLQHQ